MPIPQDIGSFSDLRDIGDLIVSWYDQRWERWQPIYPKFFNESNGSRYTETIHGLAGPNEMDNISFGQATPMIDILQGYKTTINATKWAKGLAFTQEAISFDQSGRLKRAAEGFAVSARSTAETRAARVLNNAIITNHQSTGVPLGSTAQPILRTGGTFSNRIAGDIGVTTLDAALVQFAKFVDDSGVRLNLTAKYLVHTADDQRVARQLVRSPMEPYTADHQSNVFQGLEPIMWPWLTDADNWFLLADKGNTGLEYFSWQGMRRVAWTDQDADVLKFKATQLMETTFSDYRGTIVGVGA